MVGEGRGGVIRRSRERLLFQLPVQGGGIFYSVIGSLFQGLVKHFKMILLLNFLRFGFSRILDMLNVDV